MLCAVLLSVHNGVGGCLWPMSSKVSRIGVACCEFTNSPATLASVVDAITFLMIFERTYIGPLKRLSFLLPI